MLRTTGSTSDPPADASAASTSAPDRRLPYAPRASSNAVFSLGYSGLVPIPCHLLEVDHCIHLHVASEVGGLGRQAATLGDGVGAERTEGQAEKIEMGETGGGANAGGSALAGTNSGGASEAGTGGVVHQQPSSAEALSKLWS